MVKDIYSSFSTEKKTDWFSPVMHSDMLLGEKRDDILLFLMYKGMGFPSEVARDIGLNIEEINKILFNLHKLGYIERLYPNPDTPQPPVKGRLVELWARNIVGFPAISQYSWWIITLGGIEYIRAKYKNCGKRIRNSIVMHWGLQVVPEEQDQKEVDELFDIIIKAK